MKMNNQKLPGEPFSLHAAMAGEPLVFRNGMAVNAQFRYHGESLPFAFRLELHSDTYDQPVMLYYNQAGQRYEHTEDQFDLFMAPKATINNATSAAQLLAAAAKHMEDRAATYDQSQGERSIGKTVSAFNAITGRNITEHEGWLFMVCLKNVRAFQRQGVPHRDSLEDGIAYQSLMAESMLQ